MVNTNLKNFLKAEWIFLVLMIATYLVLLICCNEVFGRAFSLFGAMLLKIIPVLLAVYILFFWVNYFVEPKKIKKHLGRESGLKGILLSIVAGILSSGSIYLWYPLLADLKKQGMSNKLIAIFLYNRAIKIPLLIMMVYYFGILFTVTVSILIIVFSIINGKLVEILLPFEIKEGE